MSRFRAWLSRVWSAIRRAMGGVWFQRLFGVYLFALGIYALFWVGGTFGTIIGAGAMFCAGGQCVMLVLVEPYREISKGWETLYHQERGLRQQLLAFLTRTYGPS